MGIGPGQNLPDTINSPKPKSGGPGTELTKLLRRMRIRYTAACKCKKRALLMNSWGPEECRQRLDEIVGWMEEESKRRKLPFVRSAARGLVRLAIRRAEKIDRGTNHGD